MAHLSKQGHPTDPIATIAKLSDWRGSSCVELRYFLSVRLLACYDSVLDSGNVGGRFPILQLKMPCTRLWGRVRITPLFLRLAADGSAPLSAAVVDPNDHRQEYRTLLCPASL